MPHQAPLLSGDPRRVGRYRIAGRIAGIPSDGLIFVGAGPDGTEVSITVLRSDWTRDGAARDRFAAEAAVAERVPPFCAARILDAGLDGQDAFLVSEYVPGQSLLEVVSTKRVLDSDDVGRVAIGMATGLASVHTAGLVHGNFGPEYVIMTAAGPRVVEFGITPPYGTATPAADMLAWARTVVFAATGRPPTRMTDLDSLPGYIHGLVVACLDPNPAERPTARAAVQELIGDDDLPAGLLAEGSRRSAPGSAVPPQSREARETRGHSHHSHHGQHSQPREVPEPQYQPGPVIRQASAAPGAGARSPVLDEPYGPPGENSWPDDGSGPRPVRLVTPGSAAGTAPPGRPAGHGSGRAASVPAPRARPDTGSFDGARFDSDSARSDSARPSSRHSRGHDDGPRARQAPSAQAERPVAHHERSSSGRRIAVIAAGALVVVAVVAFVLVNLVGHSAGHQPQAGSGKATKPAVQHSPTKSTVTPSVVATVPVTFAGTWSGQVQQPPDDTYSVTLTLASGGTTGTASYSTAGNISCSPELALTQATSHELTLSQAAEGSCTAGTVTITLTGTDSVWYHFSGGDQTVTGTLAKG